MNIGDLSLRNVSLYLGKTEVLRDISFSLQKGQTLTVVGPSGCGKSSLLNIIGGIIKHHTGEVSVGSSYLQDADLQLGYVPQNLGLLPWKKVRSNILLPFSINRKYSVDSNQLDYVLEKLDLKGLLDRYPSQLSGGQRQRVALARVFVSRPNILLMDEPFSALDMLTADVSRNLFLELWNEYRPTTIFTTHNLTEAIKLGENIMLLSKQPATVLEYMHNPLFNNALQQDEVAFSGYKKQLISWLRYNDSYKSTIEENLF